VRRIIEGVKNAGRRILVETEVREILKAYGLPMSNFKLVKNKREAVKVANEIGYPVAMKIVSPNIIHKSDAGCVKLNLKNKDDVVKAFTEIIDNALMYDKRAEIYGVIITPMEDKGTEIIIGVTNDPVFGHTHMFGLGGIFVEVLKDLSFRVGPLGKSDAYEMVKEIRGYPILKGIRGEKAKDIDAIVDIMLKISSLVSENEVISELDLNPIFVFEKGASIVDARLMLSGDESRLS
jgi:acetyltransferase